MNTKIILLVVVLGVIYFFGTKIYASTAGSNSSQKYINGIRSIGKSDVVKFKFSSEWVYVPGTPVANWAINLQDGIKFQMNNYAINLANLGNGEKEGILYNRLIAEKDGFIFLGAGADWWFEVCVNGEVAYTTFPVGNNTNDFSYLNHSFVVPVKKGENLLAVKVKGGACGYFFTINEFPCDKIKFPFVDYKAYNAPELSDKDSWTMVMIPDTQSYVKFSRNHGACDTMFSFIAENIDKLKIQQVIHVGDLVEQNRSLKTGFFGNQTAPQQWQAISDMFKRFDNKVPYIITTGNHDLGDVSSEDRQSELGKYFPIDRNSKWQDCLREVGVDGLGNKTLENAVYEFTTPNGQKILIVAIGFAPTDATLKWAKDIFDSPKYQKHFGIIVTHGYLHNIYEKQRIQEEDYQINKEGGNAGEAIWQKLVKVTPNIRMVLCGHVAGENDWQKHVNYQVSTNDAGKKVHEILFNAQALGGGWYGNGGDGWIRLMEFDKEMKKIKVRTFSPLFAISPLTWHLAWEDSEFNNFIINLED